jgi:anaerobic ribonucleoside-triphosphate reductase activating protein
LEDFDITLYTGYDLEDVPTKILDYLDYIKVGPFIQELQTSTTPYVGSTNQKFIALNRRK